LDLACFVVGFVVDVVGLVCFGLDLVCCLEVCFGFCSGLACFLVDGFGFVVDVVGLVCFGLDLACFD
jgi:hypothetical protein